MMFFAEGEKCSVWFCRNHNTTSSNFDYDDDEVLDCGKPVNFTYYDNLVGVLNRYRHPMVPEPQVALIFSKTKKNSKGQIEIDINALERKLKKAKREVRFWVFDVIWLVFFASFANNKWLCWSYFCCCICCSLTVALAFVLL